MNQLLLFARTLPRFPFAADDFAHGVYKHPKIEAIEKRYIQVNPAHRCYWLPFDIDRPGGAHDWQDRAPAPAISVESPATRRAHLLYGLAVPLDVRPDANAKALRYAAAVESALRAKLDADASFSGFMVKNPLHRDWIVTEWEPRPYELADLACHLDLRFDARRRQETYGLGRNVGLFTSTRQWAYRAIRQAGWPALATWIDLVTEHAHALNVFPAPLPSSEVRSIARSVARWTHAHMTPEAFSQIQAARAVKLSDRRRAETEARRQGLLSFVDTLPPGISIRAAARMHGTPFETARRLLSD